MDNIYSINPCTLSIILSTSANEDDLVRNVALLTLIPFSLAFAFIVFVLYRERREATYREHQADLNRKIAEVEMKALRAQMNPHFLFNCLNSINSYICSNQGDAASAYLVKFSNLMRMVLENSLHREVTLEEDLSALDLYIQMERMRMGNSFSYIIKVDPSVDRQQVMVPPLLLQPFVENSIWHGLSNKINDGILSIFITRNNAMLQLEIEDNGELKEVVPPILNKKKSLGMSLTRERLNILNESKTLQSTLHLTDKVKADGSYGGKKVVLLIPFENGE